MACNLEPGHPYEPLAEWEIALLFQDTVTTSEQDVVDAIFGPPPALPFSSRQASLHPRN